MEIDINKPERKKVEQMMIVGTVIFVLVIIAVISGAMKANYHLDEYLTYVLANSSNGSKIQLQEGVAYTGDDAFMDYFTVQRGHEFDYATVWKNQSEDVHPPLYYVFVHTISSFFPGSFSKWFGLAVNILFYILSGIFVYMISARLFRDRIKALIILIIWGTSAGILNTVVFIRMYMMVSFFILAAIYLHLDLYKRKRPGIKFYTLLFLTTVGGGLTHYYFVVFIFFTAFYYVIFLLVQKRFRDLLLYIVTYLLSAGTAILIFPSMIDQVFFGYRGEAAFEAMESNSNFLNTIFQYASIIISKTMGYSLIFFLILAAGILLIIRRFKISGIKRGMRKIFRHPASAMFLVSIMYFLVIARIAPYITDRYIAPIFGLVYIVVFTVLLKILCLLKMKENRKYLFMIITGAVLLPLTWSHGIENLYLNRQEGVRIAEENSNLDVIFVYDGKIWKLCPDIKELDKYHSFTVLKKENLENYFQESNLEGSESYVVYILYTLDQEEILSQIRTSDKDISNVEVLYDPGDSASYAASYLILQ